MSSASAAPTVEIAAGVNPLPLIGLGTWQASRGEVGAAVRAAILAGYRHIDTATIYGNEAEIGEELDRLINTEHVVTREELFIVTKLWNTEHAPDRVRAACEQSLQRLKLAYVDLYLIHWPMAFESAGSSKIDETITILDTWREMEKLVDAGLTKSIGISNFTVPQVEALCAEARIRPAVNQVECHLYLPQNRLHEALTRHGIHMTAYSPLAQKSDKAGGRVMLEDPVVTRLAAKYSVDPANIALRWLLQRGISVIPKSVNSARVESNFRGTLAFELSSDDMKELSAIEFRFRFANPVDFWNFDLFADESLD